jgi:hypothetical protein
LWPYVDEFLKKRTSKKASRKEDIEKGKEKEEVESNKVQKKASGKIYKKEKDFQGLHDFHKVYLKSGFMSLTISGENQEWFILLLIWIKTITLHYLSIFSDLNYYSA